MGNKRVSCVVKVVLSLCLAVCLGAVSAWAGPPTGEYQVTVGGDSEIWLPDGTSHLCDTENGDEICVDTLSLTNAGGAITGTGEIGLHLLGLLDANMPIEFDGQLGGSTKSPSAKLEAEGSTDAVLQGTDVGDLKGTLTGTSKMTCKNPLPHGD